MEVIRRAVRVGDLQPINLQVFPVEAGEGMYGSVPLFRPAETWRWAKDRYPKTFSYFAKDFRNPTSQSTTPENIPARVATLLNLMTELNGRPQKDITAVIQERLHVSKRDAQAYAALIRPDEEASRDHRASRRRVVA